MTCCARGLVRTDWRFRRAYCLQHQGDDADVRGCKHIWNVAKYLPDYKAQHSERQPSTYSPPWEYQIATSYLNKMAVCWVVAPCSLVEVHRHFRDACSLWRWRQQVPLKCQQTSTRLHGATTQKTAILVRAAFRTSNPTKSIAVKTVIQTNIKQRKYRITLSTGLFLTLDISQRYITSEISRIIGQYFQTYYLFRNDTSSEGNEYRLCN
jgi:hypothetical protein